MVCQHDFCVGKISTVGELPPLVGALPDPRNNAPTFKVVFVRMDISKKMCSNQTLNDGYFNKV